MIPLARVTTARESAALDASTIAAGVPSWALMQRAGAAAASEIARRYASLLREPAAIYVGPGNNGGDGWVVARALAAAGVRVRVVTAGDARTDDAKAERALAEPLVEREPPAAPPLIIDALLGTGSSGAPRGEVAAAIAAVNAARDAGATVVALDVPSGLDADGGDATHSVRADLTLTFGTMKRGLLVGRGVAGRIVLLDIGLLAPPDEGALRLVSSPWVLSRIPAIPAEAHKGIRKKLVIIGGQIGMAGAPMLAARAAMRSGIGMVRLVVAHDNLPIVQEGLPEALARPWPGAREDEVREAVTDWADAVLIGPGLGETPESRSLAERVLSLWRGPVVVDADGLNVFRGDAKKLSSLLAGRPALLTPHVAEFSRLHGASPDDVLARRFDIGVELARLTSAMVLLKGVPTIVSSATGARLVSAAGTPALAAAGSGDLLAGIAATLLSHTGDALFAGAAAAWAHGTAAELAGENGPARGVTLTDIEAMLSRVWRLPDADCGYPVLAELPAAEPRP